jgi:tetratricopeptide (TPR) repeat protein
MIGCGFVFAAPADAQSAQQIRWCNGDDHATSEQSISGCTALIQSGKSSRRNLAIAYTNRGSAYDDLRDEDRAIADQDQAIKIDPKLDLAFNNRANAYGRKGEIDRALADYDEAIRLNPKFFRAFNHRGTTYRDESTTPTGRSRTTTRRSSSAQSSPTLITTAGSPMRPRATIRTRWPITPAPSASIRISRWPTTIAACNIATKATTPPPS